MEHNSLTSIASARPVIFAEGLFVSCYLQHGEFVPEEGISETDLLSVLSGELRISGADLIEDYALQSKLNNLRRISKNIYELDQFPVNIQSKSSSSTSSSDTESENENENNVKKNGRTHSSSSNNDSNENNNEDIQMLQLKHLRRNQRFVLDSRTEAEIKLRQVYEKQVSWVVGDEGEDFVCTETFSSFTDALLLLDVLKQFNVPAVVSFLARRDEPVALTFSKTEIGLDCLMFCLFQA